MALLVVVCFVAAWVVGMVVGPTGRPREEFARADAWELAEARAAAGPMAGVIATVGAEVGTTDEVVATTGGVFDVCCAGPPRACLQRLAAVPDLPKP